ncbi:MAG: DUF6265 family protein [Xanthomonadales bacterium]|nr:DUF6265 family protein [Xanthomonadales bacterium]
MQRLTLALSLFPALVWGDAGQDLDWLLGCWQSSDQSAQEIWVRQDRHSLLGFGVALKDNQVVFYEVLSLQKNHRGTWVYTAHPAGQTATSFSAVEITQKSALFANPDHDYPQEISYLRQGNQLNARISLTGGASPNAFDKRACGG